MKNLLSVVVLLALLYARGVESLPTGAPAGACDTLTPLLNPAGHADPPQTTAAPYWIDLQPFNNSGITWQYTPGKAYTLTLSGEEDFRGFFVQARTVADDTSRVGSFGVVDTTNSRLSSCPIDTDGITHTNRNNKTAISFTWTAPPKGTGAIRFGFSVVQVQLVYWADQRTEMIAEGEADSATTREADSAATHLTSAGLWSILMVIALGLALKTAF